MQTVIRWGLAPSIAILAFCFAPAVPDPQSARELAAFFTAAATVLGAFIIALAVMSVATPVASRRVMDIVGRATLVFLGAGIVASIAGCVGSWPVSVYPYLFALAAGSAVSTVVAITRFGIANMLMTRDDKVADLAQTLAAGFSQMQATQPPAVHAPQGHPPGGPRTSGHHAREDGTGAHE